MTSTVLALPFLVLAAMPADAPSAPELHVVYRHAGLYSLETDGHDVRSTCACLPPRPADEPLPPGFSSGAFVRWPPGTQIGGDGGGPLVDAVLSAEQSARLRELLASHEVATLRGPDRKPETLSYGGAFESSLWIKVGDSETRLEWTGDSIWTDPAQKARVSSLVDDLRRFCWENACKPACDAAEDDSAER